MTPKYLTDPKTGKPKLPRPATQLLRCGLCRTPLVRSSAGYLCCPAKLHGRLYQIATLARGVAESLPLSDRQRRRLADDESGRYALRLLVAALRVLHLRGVGKERGPHG